MTTERAELCIGCEWDTMCPRHLQYFLEKHPHAVTCGQLGELGEAVSCTVQVQVRVKWELCTVQVQVQVRVRRELSTATVQVSLLGR